LGWFAGFHACRLLGLVWLAFVLGVVWLAVLWLAVQ